MFVCTVLLATAGVVRQRWLSVDVALMAALGVVTVGGVIEPHQAVAGFASTAVAAIASLYVLAAAAGRAGLLAAGWTPDSVAEAGGGDVRSPGRLQYVALGLVVFALVVCPIAGLLAFETAALFGAVAVVASGVLSPSEARRAVDWRIVIAVGAMLGLARAAVASGLPGAIAGGMAAFGSGVAVLAAAAASAVIVSVLSSRTPRQWVASGAPVLFALSLHFGVGVGM